MPPRRGRGGIDGIDETTEPDTRPAGPVAVLEALTGQIFLATLVARLVAAYRGPAERQS